MGTSLWAQPSPPDLSNGQGASTRDIPQHNRGKITSHHASKTPTCLLDSLICRVPVDVPLHFPSPSFITRCLDPMGYPLGGGRCYSLVTNGPLFELPISTSGSRFGVVDIQRDQSYGIRCFLHVWCPLQSGVQKSRLSRTDSRALTGFGVGVSLG